MMANPKNLMAAFGVAATVDSAAMSATQHLTRDLADHRGRAEMPAYAMVAESMSSGTFWHSFEEPVGTVQSWLSLTAGAPVKIDDRLYTTSELLHNDGAHGIVALRITNDDDDVVCAGLARCVLVGRTGASLAKIKKTLPAASHGYVRHVEPTATMPAPIDEALDGAGTLAAIADGTLSPGPLCELLSATVLSSDTEVRMVIAPQPWMINPLGAIQGGVMSAMLGQACSFAGQMPTAPGQAYSMADLSVYFFRSPPGDDTVTVVSSPDRVGRRLGTVSASMRGADGDEFARATANIRFH